jgi:glutaredoxin-related protein
MFKNLFFIISICILFFGCKKSEKTTEYTIDSEDDNEETELIKGLIEEDYDYNELNRSRLVITGHNNYLERDKSFYVWSLEDFVFLKSLSQDELSENLRGLHFVLFEDIENIDNIETINNLHNLESLSISYRAIPLISNFQSLKRLKIKDVNSYLLDLTHIGKFQNLEYLNITCITQDGLNILSSLTNLKQLKELEFTFLAVDNFSPLLNLSSLESLRLYGIDPNKANIMPLAASKSLNEITLYFFSEEEYTEFKNDRGKIFEEKGIYIDSIEMWRR